jgi:hypothetical protein
MEKTDIEGRRLNGRMWTPGQSGNRGGRPIGARGRFSQQFIQDLLDSWEQHGATVMDRVAKEFPDRYLGIAAHLIPKEIEATIMAQLPLDQTDLELLRAIRTALPSANQMTPQAAFEYTLEALRAHGAKLLPSDCRTDV